MLRAARLIALASITLTAASLTACATTSAPAVLDDRSALQARGGADAPARLPPPDGSSEAQSYLSGALAALRANQPQHAALFLDAILQSDHLSDRGRANIYWLAADAHRLSGHDSEYVDALGGFLVAADLLPNDEDLRRREVEARASLLARKVKRDPQLGKSPQDAIRVEDARDAPGIVAELGCVEDTVATHGDGTAIGERRLEERSLICREAGRVVLWFDVTSAR